MMKRDDSLSEGEFIYLCQRALYVQPPQRPIDFNTIPDDGNEFIHKSRLENSRLDFHRSDIEEESSGEVERISKTWLRKVAAEFAQLANELQSDKELLKKKFPQSAIIPIDDEIESCVFCLGSAKCLGIYDCGPRSFAEAHEPLLSHVIHLNQREIQKLLRYTFNWYKSIGMDEDIGRWLFALLACTDKPLSDRLEEFLVDYFADFKMHLQICEEHEYLRVRIVMSLLENYFVIKPNQHNGAYLNQLLRLRS